MARFPNPSFIAWQVADDADHSVGLAHVPCPALGVVAKFYNEITVALDTCGSPEDTCPKARQLQRAEARFARAKRVRVPKKHR